MGTVISKWIVPGVVTVVVGTLIAVFFSQSIMEEDLTQRAQAEIGAQGEQGAGEWALITFDGRDATISGVTTDPDMIDPLISQIAALHGVRSVTSEIIPAPSASPYPFSARLENGEITLSGGVPSMKMRDELLAESDANDGGLDLLSGVPDGDWKGATLFAISQLEGLESGEALLEDLSLSISGTARTPQSFVELSAVLMGELPAGVTLGNVTIEPAMVDDFTFEAARENSVTSVSGFVSDEATRERIGELTGADTTGLLLARGAPDSLPGALDFGLAVLSHMSDGELKISGAGLSVRGVAASHEGYNAAVELLGMGAPDGVVFQEISLEPLTEENYTWSVEKLADGTLDMEGFIPDAATRSALVMRAGADAMDKMQVANGAPATFYEDALVAISALKNLETGISGFDGEQWFLSGQPAGAEEAKAATGALITARTMADRWKVTLAEPLLIPVVPYTWSARKSADGQIVLKGNVPDDLTRVALLQRAGDRTVDEMVISPGAPETFYEDALVAVFALRELESGRAGHGAKGWYLSGQPLDSAAVEAANVALITARTPSSKWNVDLAKPLEAEEPVEMVEEASSDTAVETIADTASASFAAELSEGALLLSGQVPDRDSRNILGLVSGGANTTGLLESSAGVPEDFLANARAGIGALRQLEEGRMKLEGGEWSLTGKAKSEEARGAALGFLAGVQDSTRWQADITLFSPEELCQSEAADYSGATSIEFATGSAQITADTMPIVQEMADYLNRCTAFSLNVEGHTDNQGDFAGNLKLSIDRADAVIAALSDMGVAEERMLSVGFGDARPVETNDTAEGRQANRRIVFQVKE